MTNIVRVITSKKNYYHINNSYGSEAQEIDFLSLLGTKRTRNDINKVKKVKNKIIKNVIQYK